MSEISNAAKEGEPPSKEPEKITLGKFSDVKFESRLNIKDLEALQEAFMAEGDGYDNRLSLTKAQFCEALAFILNKGSREEHGDLFDKMDVSKEGVVDWDKLASHLLLELYERDDRVKSTQVPRWRDFRNLPSPHKDVIQKMCPLPSNRYLAISKEGCVSLWSGGMRLVRSLKTGTDSCRSRDLWVTSFVPLHNLNKIALSFTSKEIAIYDLGTKLEFNCQYKVQELDSTPLTLDYWANPSDVNEAILSWGDTGGSVNALHFSSANIALFERPSAPAGEKQEPCLNVLLKDVIKKKFKNASFVKHHGHTEWVRQVRYSAHLECVISCATTWNNSLVIGWMEKNQNSSKNMKTTVFQIAQGVSSFDYHERLNLIATAGVNHHVCLWNPYVVSKPNGVLRGHMAAVVQVQFIRSRGQLVSFSKDKVLRIWDVQLQVCIQRLAGIFPKGPEVTSILYFDERYSRLFITFNYQLAMLEMKPEVKDRVMTHDKAAVAAIYSATYNQVVTASQSGTLTMWLIDTGQKVKVIPQAHGNSELTTLTQDLSETRLLTGSTDGTVKIWDFNGHCYHTLHCGQDGQPADVGQVLSLKRTFVVVGWVKYITVFRNQTFKDFHVQPSDWKGGQEHVDDILSVAFSPPNALVTGSYDGEIIVWSNSSEQASRRLTQRSRRVLQKGRSTLSHRELSQVADQGFDSHAFQERPLTRSKSRSASRISLGGTDDSNEYGLAVTRLAFLGARGVTSPTGGANLVSGGGNGWVRFWNTLSGRLLGEFCAHTQVGSIILAVHPDDNEWLVTADVDGVVKVWDISDHCLQDSDVIIKNSPRLQTQFQPHVDMINSVEVFTRNAHTLIMTSSTDCSVQLWDVHGNRMGVFGQEAHWKIEPYVPQTEADEAAEELGTQPQAEPETPPENDEKEEMLNMADLKDDVTWQPDDKAVVDPANYRINVWQESDLGKDYRELRIRKRERKQPQLLEDLPYLHWERTGAPPAGPFAALDTKDLQSVGVLTKPDFMLHPHKYFTEKAPEPEPSARVPALAEGLRVAYDEKTLFPKYMLDFDAKQKQRHHAAISENTKKAGQGLMRAAFGLGAPANQGTSSVSSTQSPGGRKPGPVKPRTLKPLKSGSVASS